jgi:hypothetical protein
VGKGDADGEIWVTIPTTVALLKLVEVAEQAAKLLHAVKIIPTMLLVHPMGAVLPVT